MNDENTRLDYEVTPSEIFYTRDSRNPSIAILNISASNTGDEEAVIKRFQVSVPISANPDDKDALTAEASSIIPVSQQPDKWDFSEIEPGLYEAKPIAPVKGVAAGKSINFQLKNVIVNQAAGTVIITIAEQDTTGAALPATKKVVKIKSDLDIEKFEAVPANITSGDPCVLSWITVGAAKVTLAPGDFPDIKVNDSVVVRPELTTTYTLTASGEGPNVSQQRTVQIPPPKIVSFKAEPAEVNAGDEVTLSWTVEYADKVSIVPGGFNDLPLTGSVKAPVQTDTTFIITATNKGHQSASLPFSVTVKPVQIKSFKAKPGYGVQAGDAVELSWEIESATSAYIQPGSINIPKDSLKKGSRWVSPTGPTSYSLTAQNGLDVIVHTIDVMPMPSGWHKYTSGAPFTSPTLGVLMHQVKMWLFTQSGRTYNSWDGQNWTVITATAGWQQRTGCAVCVFNDKMWLLGGEKQGNYLNDVWTSPDGVSWTQVTTAAQWPARKDFVSYTIPGSNRIFIAGGAGKIINVFNDIWSSADGITWSQESNNAFAGGGRSSMAIAGPEPATYILGGTTAAGTVNETYITTDGKTWSKLGTPNWPARTNTKACITPLGIFFGYGQNNGNNLTDFYLLNGTGCFLQPVSPQAANTSPFLLQYQEAPWILGSSQTSSAGQDVWSFNPGKETKSKEQIRTFTDFYMGSEGASCSFMLNCKNLPVGSVVGFYADRLGTNPAICVLDISVTNQASFNVGIKCSVPANFGCNISAYAIAINGKFFTDDSSIEIDVYLEMF